MFENLELFPTRQHDAVASAFGLIIPLYLCAKLPALWKARFA